MPQPSPPRTRSQASPILLLLLRSIPTPRPVPTAPNPPTPRPTGAAHQSSRQVLQARGRGGSGRSTRATGRSTKTRQRPLRTALLATLAGPSSTLGLHTCSSSMISSKRTMACPLRPRLRPRGGRACGTQCTPRQRCSSSSSSSSCAPCRTQQARLFTATKGHTPLQISQAALGAMRDAPAQGSCQFGSRALRAQRCGRPDGRVGVEVRLRRRRRSAGQEEEDQVRELLFSGG